MTKKDRVLVDYFETTRLRADLFDTGNILIMIKKTEDYSEHFKSSALGRQKEDNGSLFSPVGLSRLMNIHKGEHIFKNNQIEAILLCLEDYLDFIGWDKTRDGEGVKLFISAEKSSSEMIDEILEMDRSPKDKWCALASWFNFFSQIEPERVIEKFKNRETLENLYSDNHDYELESCTSYLFNFFPTHLVRFQEMKATKFGIEQFEDKIRNSISLLNDKSGKTISEIDLDNGDSSAICCDDLEYGFKAVLSYHKILSKMYKVVDVQNVDNLTRDQFINLFAPLFNFVNFYRSNEKKNFAEIFEFHYERVVNGVECNKKSLAPNYYSVDFSSLMTEEEFDMFKNVEQTSVPVARFVKDRISNFKLFLNFSESFVSLAHDYDSARGLFDDKTIASSVMANKEYYNSVIMIPNGLLRALQDNPSFNQVFMDYLKDPSIPLSMMLEMNGTIEDYIVERDSNIAKRNSLIREEFLYV